MIGESIQLQSKSEGRNTQRARKLRKRSLARNRLLRLEPLEDRHLLSTVGILKDIDVGAGGSWPADYTEDWEPVVVGNALYSVADDGINGKELWKTDGTEAGTQMVANLATGSASSNPTNLTAIGDWLWFGATNTAGHTSGLQIYRTNETTTEFIHS